MKKQVVEFFVKIIIIVCFSGCAGIKLTEDRNQASKLKFVEDDSYSTYVPFFKSATTPVDLDRVCPKNAWKDVYLHRTFSGGLITIFTLGILNPERIEVNCFE